jgi:phospholipid/cholesterol/gamma-HCH transport system permease protein
LSDGKRAVAKREMSGWTTARHVMIERLGAATVRRIQRFFYAMGFFLEVLKKTGSFLLRRTPGSRVLTMQILFTGVESLTVIGVASLSIGAVIVVQGLALLPQFGQGQVMYPILVAVITRELGPILTAFIVAARSGTAITTELGTMVINHEIEAYVATGIDPISFLVVPRFLGVTISIIILNVYFNAFGLLGSYMVTQFVRPIGFVDYFTNLLATLGLVDVLASFIKSIVFGTIISVVATYYGFKVERASTEVPQMAIKSVGQGFVLLIVANAIITAVYYI